FARLDREDALRDWRAQWQSLLTQARLPPGAQPPPAGQALVPMQALLMGKGQLDLAQRWGEALDQVSAGLKPLTPRSTEDELLAVAQAMKAVTVLFQNEVATALDVPLGFSDADGD
ncbi:MAG TPA: peptidase M75, partial [Hydrogenophaga sp.]|nr:peptidase M75 [Hydrogenophaga sp.]